MHYLLAPFGSAGDVHPLIGLGQALAERGHRISVLVNPTFAPLVTARGWTLYPLGTVENYRSAIADARLWQPRQGFRVIVQTGLAPSFEPTREAIRQFLADGGDAVIAPTLQVGARSTCEEWKVPLATVHLQPIALQSVHGAVVLPGLHLRATTPRWVKRILFRLMDWMSDRELSGPLNEFRRHQQSLAPVRRILFGWGPSPDLQLGLWPDWYGPPQPDWSPAVKLVGFPLYDERDVTTMPVDVTTFLDRGTPPLVFTPGSAMAFANRFFVEAVQVCQRLGRRGVFLTSHPEQLPNPLPSEILPVRWVPLGPLLERAAALIHHGGIGTTARGLAAGIPQVVAAYSFDQPDNGVRLARLGVGDWISAQRFTADRVVPMLDRLLHDSAVATATAHFAQRLAEPPPWSQVDDWLSQSLFH